MKQLLLVFIGGGIGSALRFTIGKWLKTVSNSFPFSTFLVNVIGCFIIGIVLGLAVKQQNISTNQSLLLATGFCGGFTTFSAFAFENYQFLKTGDITQFAFYTICSIVVGVGAVFFGLLLVK